MADSIERCVLSIITKNNDALQIILIDDGSTDSSLEICRKLAEIDNRIVVLHQENQGSGPARNEGIKAASGDYVLFMDSDDYLNASCLHTLLEEIETSQEDLIVFGYNLVSPSGSTTIKEFEDRFLEGNDIRNDYCPFFNNLFKWAIQGAPWNKLFKLSKIKENNIVFPSLRRHQDEVFISRFVNIVQTVRFTKPIVYTHFANDVKLIWKKYPENYYDIIRELYFYRQNIVEKWNPQNEKLKSLTYSEYINNTFRDLFKLFNKEKGFRLKDRLGYYEITRERFEFKKINFSNEYIGRMKVIQNKLFLFFLSHKLYFFLDCLVKLRLGYFIHG